MDFIDQYKCFFIILFIIALIIYFCFAYTFHKSHEFKKIIFSKEFIIAIVTSLVVIVGWLYISSEQIKLEKIKMSMGVYAEFAKNYNNNYVFIEDKIKGEKLSAEDEAKINEIIAGFNTTLSQLYIYESDDRYKILVDNFKDNEPTAYKDLGENLLVIMRKMNSENKLYFERYNIKLYNYIKSLKNTSSISS